MADEPYLKDKGLKSLYMNYQTNDEMKNLLIPYSYEELYRKEKIETSDAAINSNSVTTAFVLLKKIK